MKIFISHATEDKEEIARPLAKALQKKGYEIWYDEYSLKLGDSLTGEIDRGLVECDYGVVILSKAFFAKKWPQRELAGLVARETSPTGSTVILPVWHQIDANEIRRYSPTLADRIAVSTASGLRKVVSEIVKAVGGQEKKSKPTDNKSLDQIQALNTNVEIPSLVAWRILSRTNILTKGEIRQSKNKKYYWSPDIEDIVKRANYGDSADLWDYMYFSCRTIFLNEIIDDSVSNLAVALITYLNQLNPRLPIHFYITTMGGQIYSGLAIYDIMQTISAPVYTYGIDTVGGFGSLLLAAGSKGYRFSTKETHLFFTPVTGSKRGNPEDQSIQEKLIVHFHNTMTQLYSNHTKVYSAAIVKNFSSLKELSSEEAIQYGFVDRTLLNKSLLPPWKWGYDKNLSHMQMFF